MAFDCPRCGSATSNAGVVKNPNGQHHTVQVYRCSDCGWRNI